MAAFADSENLIRDLFEIAGQLLKKSRAGKVYWQTVGGEPHNYYVHFGDQTSFVVCLQSPAYSKATASISLEIKSMTAARISAEDGEENFATFKEIFDEAHRAATSWNTAIAMIREKIASDDPIGDPPGDIPL